MSRHTNRRRATLNFPPCCFARLPTTGETVLIKFDAAQRSNGFSQDDFMHLRDGESPAMPTVAAQGMTGSAGVPP